MMMRVALGTLALLLLASCAQHSQPRTPAEEAALLGFGASIANTYGAIWAAPSQPMLSTVCLRDQYVLYCN